MLTSSTSNLKEIRRALTEKITVIEYLNFDVLQYKTMTITLYETSIQNSYVSFTIPCKVGIQPGSVLVTTNTADVYWLACLISVKSTGLSIISSQYGSFAGKIGTATVSFNSIVLFK